MFVIDRFIRRRIRDFVKIRASHGRQNGQNRCEMIVILSDFYVLDQARAVVIGDGIFGRGLLGDLDAVAEILL